MAFLQGARFEFGDPCSMRYGIKQESIRDDHSVNFCKIPKPIMSHHFVIMKNSCKYNKRLGQCPSRPYVA
jgi:hypothetical protein